MTFLYSQTVCPPVVSTDIWTTPTDFEYSIPDIGKIGKVSYRKTTNTNPVKIAIDWTTLTDKNPGLTDEAIKEFLEHTLIYDAVTHDPLNPNQVFMVSVYYKTPCMTEQMAAIQMDHHNILSCCDDNVPRANLNYQHVWYQYEIRKVPCGDEKCCARVYQIKCPTPSTKEIQSINKVSVVDCNGQGAAVCYPPSTPPVINPCQGDC
jgi:hypothetical protein